MECERQIFCHFGSFFGLSQNYRPPKIKIWKKHKKLLEILFKSVITTIFPSDYFKENKMKKNSQKNTKFSVLGTLLAQIQAKVKFLQILDYQFLGVKII